MSRTRIVKGKITEITGGTLRIYGNRIIINSGGRIDFFAPKYTYGDPGEPPVSKFAEFDIKFELDTTEETIVPFGLLDFENKAENQFFKFKYTLEKSDIDEFYLDIISENGDYLYTHNCLKPAIIDNEYKEPLFKTEKTSQIPMNSVLIPEGSPDFEPKDYTAMGTYIISWDGFDKNGIYDSTRFNNKNLKAKITAIKNGRRKSIVVDFSTKYSQVEWADVKIDKNTNRIDVTLRVNLTDGGAEGLNCSTANASDIYRMPARTICDWDKISAEAQTYYNQPPIKVRNKTFEQLRNLATDGVDKHWSRNSNNIGKGVNISGELFEVFVTSKVDKNGLSSPEIVYQTNMEESRSRNFELSRKLFFYEGYLYKDDWRERPKTILFQNKGWYFRSENKVDEKNTFINLPSLIEDYQMVSAHEIGHEILLSYGEHTYSKTHKGTSHWSMIIQDVNDNATYIPTTGEIDLMKYYIDSYDIPRTIISEFDLLKVIWLTKIKIS